MNTLPELVIRNVSGRRSSCVEITKSVSVKAESWIVEVPRRLEVCTHFRCCHEICGLAIGSDIQYEPV